MFRGKNPSSGILLNFNIKYQSFRVSVSLITYNTIRSTVGKLDRQVPYGYAVLHLISLSQNEHTQFVSSRLDTTSEFPGYVMSTKTYPTFITN